MKKLLSIILSLLLCFTLAGCNKQDEIIAENSQTEASSSRMPRAVGDIVISYLDLSDYSLLYISEGGGIFIGASTINVQQEYFTLSLFVQNNLPYDISVEIDECYVNGILMDASLEVVADTAQKNVYPEATVYLDKPYPEEELTPEYLSENGVRSMFRIEKIEISFTIINVETGEVIEQTGIITIE
jgi:hypothetical protein